MSVDSTLTPDWVKPKRAPDPGEKVRDIRDVPDSYWYPPTQEELERHQNLANTLPEQPYAEFSHSGLGNLDEDEYVVNTDPNMGTTVPKPHGGWPGGAVTNAVLLRKEETGLGYDVLARPNPNNDGWDVIKPLGNKKQASFNRENVIWKRPDGTWGYGFFKVTDVGDDTEWDVDYDYNKFGWASVGHPTEEDALAAWQGANPGGGTIIEDPNDPSVQRYEQMAKECLQKRFEGYGPPGFVPRNFRFEKKADLADLMRSPQKKADLWGYHRQVPGWEYDKHIEAYVAPHPRIFTCSCGENIKAPCGFMVCPCGRQWNSFVIGLGGNHEASIDKILCREIPVRDNVIVASKREKGDLPINTEVTVSSPEWLYEMMGTTSEEENANRPPGGWSKPKPGESDEEWRLRTFPEGDPRRTKKSANERCPYCGKSTTPEYWSHPDMIGETYGVTYPCCGKTESKNSGLEYDERGRVIDVASRQKDPFNVHPKVNQDPTGDDDFPFSQKPKKVNTPATPDDWHKRNPDGTWAPSAIPAIAMFKRAERVISEAVKVARHE